MSTPATQLSRKPFIGLVEQATKALKFEMINEARASGFAEVRPSHNVVFGSLNLSGARTTTEMAAIAGITKQSMGEIVRDLVELGIVQMTPDPEDRRAKLVSYTDYGKEIVEGGRRHLAELERRFEETFGPETYEHAREVLARIGEVLDHP